MDVESRRGKDRNCNMRGVFPKCRKAVKNKISFHNKWYEGMIVADCGYERTRMGEMPSSLQ